MEILDFIVLVSLLPVSCFGSEMRSTYGIHLKGMEIQGNTIDTCWVYSWVECLSMCMDTSGCVAISFNCNVFLYKMEICHLKSTSNNTIIAHQMCSIVRNDLQNIPDMTSHITSELTSETTSGMTSQTTSGMISETTEGMISETTEGMTSQITSGITSQTTSEMTSQTSPEVTSQSTTLTEMTSQTSPEVTSHTTALTEMTSQTTSEMTSQTSPEVTSQTTTLTDMTSQTTSQITTTTTTPMATTASNTQGRILAVIESLQDMCYVGSTYDMTILTPEGVYIYDTYQDLATGPCRGPEVFSTIFTGYAGLPDISLVASMLSYQVNNIELYTTAGEVYRWMSSSTHMTPQNGFPKPIQNHIGSINSGYPNSPMWSIYRGRNGEQRFFYQNGIYYMFCIQGCTSQLFNLGDTLLDQNNNNLNVWSSLPPDVVSISAANNHNQHLFYVVFDKNNDHYIYELDYAANPAITGTPKGQVKF